MRRQIPISGSLGHSVIPAGVVFGDDTDLWEFSPIERPRGAGAQSIGAILASFRRAYHQRAWRLGAGCGELRLHQHLHFVLPLAVAHLTFLRRLRRRCHHVVIIRWLVLGTEESKIWTYRFTQTHNLTHSCIKSLLIFTNHWWGHTWSTVI